MLLPFAGKDCTEAFRKAHRWINGHSMLRKCLIGPLDGADVPETLSEESEEESSDDDERTR